MGISKHMAMLLAVILAGIAMAGQGQPRTDAEAVNLIGQRDELTRKAQVLELDVAGIDARRKALPEQIAVIRGDTSRRSAGGQLEEFTRELRRLAIDKAEKEAQLQTVHRQLEKVQKQLAQIAPAAPRTDAEAVNLGGQKSELARRAQVLELDLAGIDARQKALQEQIALIRGATGEESARGGQLEEFTRGLTRLTVDKAGTEAQLRTVRRQLAEVQKQLAQVAPSAPRTDQEAVNLGGQKSELTRRGQVLELDLAGIDARRKALQEQIAAIRGEASEGSGSGGHLEEFTRESSRLAIDKAGTEAQLRTVRRQLEEVQKQLAQALASHR
jgi:chromosome segregation ATPase